MFYLEYPFWFTILIWTHLTKYEIGSRAARKFCLLSSLGVLDSWTFSSSSSLLIFSTSWQGSCFHPMLILINFHNPSWALHWANVSGIQDSSLANDVIQSTNSIIVIAVNRRGLRKKSTILTISLKTERSFLHTAMDLKLWTTNSYNWLEDKYLMHVLWRTQQFLH